MSGTAAQNAHLSDRGPPQLPLGTGSALRGITENFSFHASPEQFIASRVIAFQQSQDANVLNKRTPIRAKILNRNVAVLSSYKQIEEVLEYGVAGGEDDNKRPAFIAADAYLQLMDQFFPPPNLLLADGGEHLGKRKLWETRMHRLEISEIIACMFATKTHPFPDTSVPLDTPVDLYEVMKALSWRILLKIFLEISDFPEAPVEEQNLFTQMQSLHEDLLRGQFSLMPVSVNVGFWKSPRSIGIESRKSLQRLISERLQELSSKQSDNSSLFVHADDGIPVEETRDHLLMMTSSLAVKGLASLLTAFLLNLFVFECAEGVIADQMCAMIAEGRQADYLKHLNSVYFETERLSPPIVGVMRRTTCDVVIQGGELEPNTLLPCGWDVWSYIVGANRDPTIFGKNCDLFDPDRYSEGTTSKPIGFGTGPKSCLGEHLVRQIVLHVADHLVTNGVNMKGSVSTPGLKAWLGWDKASPQQWAAELKQLPTQRPKKPVMVEFSTQI